MNNPLFDHSVKTIGDCNELSLTFIERKTEDVTRVHGAIAKAEGLDAADQLVTDDVFYCLDKLRNSFQPAMNMPEVEYRIYFGYLANALVGIDTVIDKEYEHLGL